MKKYIYLFIASTFLSITNINSQEIITDDMGVLTHEKVTKVRIRYVPPPKPEVKDKEFYSVQVGAFLTSVENAEFNAEFNKTDSVFHIVNEEDIYVYLSGEYTDLNDAIIEKDQLFSNGKHNLYVVKVIDKRKIVIIE